MIKCLICDTTLDEIKVTISQDKHLCFSCSNCKSCGKQVTIDEIKSCLVNNLSIRHSSCARVPKRRCIYIDDRGQQCDTWFNATSETKLCPGHREIISGPTGRVSEENKVRYIDLVNDERKYCYHFTNGASQNQDNQLIFEFKDDQDGSIYDKIDNRISFFEKVIEDLKAQLHSARAVKSEKLDELSDEEREIRRKVKIDKVLNPEKKKVPSLKDDPVSYLSKKNNMSKQDASDLLNMDTDALLAKFEAAKKLKESK